MSEFLTPVEAAECARRHPVTIRRALESGDLHGTQRVRGGRWLISPECLDAWVHGRACQHMTNVVPLRRSA